MVELKKIISIEKALVVDLLTSSSLGNSWFFSYEKRYQHNNISNGLDTIILNPNQMSYLFDLYQNRDKKVEKAITSIIISAEKYIEIPNYSVVEKLKTPPSGDKKDYYSLSKYWWPDKSKPEGIPYFRLDGKPNPESRTNDYDAVRLHDFSEVLLLLSVASFFSRDKRFIDKSGDLIKYWFINSATRQNPNFEYAQVVIGDSKVRGNGIVEARHLIYISEAIKIIYFLNGLTSHDLIALKSWFSDLLTWMEESEFGKKATEYQNNIGLWYDLQRVVYASFCDQHGKAVDILENTIPSRVKRQIMLDGSMPNELARSKPNDYVAFTLLALAQIDSYGDKYDVSIWDSENADSSLFSVANDWFKRVTCNLELDFFVNRLSYEKNKNIFFEDGNFDSQSIIDLYTDELIKYNIMLFALNNYCDLLQRQLNSQQDLLEKINKDKKELPTEFDKIKQENEKVKNDIRKMRKNNQVLQRKNDKILKRYDLLLSEKNLLTIKHDTLLQEKTQLEGKFNSIINSKAWKFISFLKVKLHR